MAAISFLKSGFDRASQKFKLSIYLWLIIIVVSLIALLPVNFQITTALGHLSWPENSLMPFELNLVEIFLTNQNLLATYFIFLLVIILLSAVLSVFLSGGLFGQMINPGNRISFPNFLAAGCRYFGRFLLSLVLFIPFLAVFFLVFKLLSAPLNFWSAQAVSDWPVILAGWLSLVLLALLWPAFKVILDLVRIFMVAESKKVTASYASAFKFLRHHFFQLWGLYLLVTLAVVVVSAIWLAICRLLSPAQPGSLFALILLGQAFVLFRLLARQVLIGVEYSYFSTRKEIVVNG